MRIFICEMNIREKFIHRLIEIRFSDISRKVAKMERTQSCLGGKMICAFLFRMAPLRETVLSDISRKVKYREPMFRKK